MKWHWWYIGAVVALTCLAYAQRMPEAWVSLLYSIPINIALYFLPVWFVVATIKHFRNWPPPPAPLEPEDDSLYDQLPNMERK